VERFKLYQLNTLTSEWIVSWFNEIDIGLGRENYSSIPATAIEMKLEPLYNGTNAQIRLGGLVVRIQVKTKKSKWSIWWPKDSQENIQTNKF
jgi:hypothetical protein